MSERTAASILQSARRCDRDRQTDQTDRQTQTAEREREREHCLPFRHLGCARGLEDLMQHAPLLNILDMRP
jgi:hypothetical protein